MESSQRFLRAIGAVLFLAVCAYLGAAIGRVLPGGSELAEVCLARVGGSYTLQGIAIRSETPLCLNRAEIMHEDGSRLKAGTVLAQNGTELLQSPCAGVFFEELDGYEYLCPEDLRDLTVSAFSGILRCNPKVPKDAVGKLVTDHCWYFAALCPASAELTVGERCSLLFEGGPFSVPARLEQISTPEGDEAALVFRLRAGDSWHLSLRFCSAQLHRDETVGLKLPCRALFTDGEGNKFVNILSEGQSVPRQVDIIYEDPDGQWCLAAASEGENALAPGDRVICSAGGYDYG